MKSEKIVNIWLWVGVAMVFVQVLLGGITRLTGSGLSITKWDILTGTIPPLHQLEWEEEFNLYKETPQYQKINTGMTLKEFKFIYFWEYVHRLWARSIGFVFLLPFFFFVYRNWLNKELYRKLGIAVLLGGVVAAFGWIMVASGLVERPWVNAYKLTVHLNLALLLYAWLFWIAMGERVMRNTNKGLKNVLNILTIIIIVQLLLGGLMSGMKACLYYPTWPDMYGEFFPKVLIDNGLWTKESIIEYEKGVVPGIVQFLHRICAYLLFGVSIVLLWKSTREQIPTPARAGIRSFAFLIVVQMGIGILTLINCVGKIPLFYGVAHQAIAIIVLSNLIYLHRIIRK